MPLATLETERLILRQVVEADAEGLHAAFGDAEAMRYWDFPPTRDVGETTGNLRRWRRAGMLRQGVWAIVLPPGGCIGVINYHHREPWNRRLELGWILAPAYWRRGLMTEAAQAVLRYCFNRLRVHRIEALIEPDNTASRALAAKLGFAQEGGRLRDRLCVAGEYRSVLMYGLLQPDWARGAAA